METNLKWVTDGGLKLYNDRKRKAGIIVSLLGLLICISAALISQKPAEDVSTFLILLGFSMGVSGVIIDALPAKVFVGEKGLKKQQRKYLESIIAESNDYWSKKDALINEIQKKAIDAEEKVWQRARELSDKAFEAQMALGDLKLI